MIITPPDTSSNPPTPGTQLDLYAGFQLDGDAKVRFGQIDLVDGKVDLTLLRGVTDPFPQYQGGPLTLRGTPVHGNKNFIVVTAVDPRDQSAKKNLELDEFGFSDGKITLTDEAAHKGKDIFVSHRPEGNHVPANVGDQMRLTMAFDPGGISGNTIGAVTVGETSSFPKLSFTGEGMATASASVDVKFLNNTVDDIFTLAASAINPLSPQVSVKTDVLEQLFSNVEFDLVSIVTGIETFLGLLEDGLTKDVVAKLPLVGEGLDTAGTFLGKLNRQLVGRFRAFLAQVGGTVDEVEEKIEWYLLKALGAAWSGTSATPRKRPDSQGLVRIEHLSTAATG